MPDTSPHPVTVRAIGGDDLPTVVDMISALAAFHGDTARTDAAALARDALGNASLVHVLVAEVAGSLVGYAAFLPVVWLQYAARGLDMHHLYVVEGWRGQGIASALLAEGTRLARDLGCTSILVGAAPDNTAAQGGDLAKGFERRPAEGARFLLQLA